MPEPTPIALEFSFESGARARTAAEKLTFVGAGLGGVSTNHTAQNLVPIIGQPCDKAIPRERNTLFS